MSILCPGTFWRKKRVLDKAEGSVYPFVCSKNLRIDTVFKDRVLNESMLIQIYYFSVITLLMTLNPSVHCKPLCTKERVWSKQSE